MAEHTALIQFPPPWRVYLITKGPGLLSTIIYSELDLKASGLETGNQEQNRNLILFVFPSQPPPPDCLPRLQAARGPEGQASVPSGLFLKALACAEVERIPDDLVLAGISHQLWPRRYCQAHHPSQECFHGQRWGLQRMLGDWP